MLPRFSRKKAAFVVSVHFELSLQSAFWTQTAFCTRYAACILYQVCSFVLGLQSAFCTDRMIGFYYEVARERKFILNKPNSIAKSLIKYGN